MTELETFQYECKQYIGIGGEKRTLFGKNFYQIYLKQCKEMQISSSDAEVMMERLVAFTAASDGEINRSEYEFCNNAIFERDASSFMKMCKAHMMPAEIQILRDFAKESFQKYGHKSGLYIIGMCIICANGEASIDEQKKFVNLFGLLDKK